MPSEFGARLAEIRTKKKLTQQALADLLGVTQVTIARYESGTVKPSWEIACRIADALKVKVDRLR